MIAPDLATATTMLREMIDESERVVPFTGAGISTESGIPDFRSPGGLWTKTQPIPFDLFIASREMRDESWRRRFAMEEYFGKARPTRGHLALASLYRAGKAPGVITQNIDNLHQSAGVPPQDVVELHGNTTFATCLDCARRYELVDVKQKFEAANGHAPDCDCGGFIKTATVSFGQSMPEEAMRRAQSWAMDCDLFIAIGSSLVVWPAASLPLQAKKSGARLIIVNREPTEFDSIADLVIRNDIGDALSPLISH
ncbi:Sir2 family NAD-dependent protein deacetylase [Pseudorhodoplanes sp.]|uniref:SIR2 family NAD-dependent protein deacylase n=1 Tax=Pseudorhodoplanes sp. TaxID=1934341 RepID=UPI002CE656BB|nr:Sir2 family NAD-dependent protein deacetylase [Pseudorhodoplanes sp.]HWV50993.1 Sir2 family NAD-dependent protein deacetylase [Pseudorhodoplanes sp.]